MRKILVQTSVLIGATLCFASCGNPSKDDQLKPTSIDKQMAMNTEIVDSPKPKVFSGFIYDIGPRFGAIKKEAIQNAKSISDFIHQEELDKIASLKSVTVQVLESDMIYKNIEKGTTATFTEAQLKLLRSLDYSTNLMLLVEFTELHKHTNSIENNYTSPYLTIVPEKQASYMFSEDTLKDYLSVNTEEVRKDVDPEKLQAAKLYFTVTKNGTVENLRLDRSSNYPKVDDTMIQLMKNLPGKWTPAENAKGEKVNQELVVSFGLLDC
ncbi:hypothetical protein SCB49_03289 [unidentified eubacterium SCB49]|nr:hypothetical protein SCB49_03289 [unidentified eubacterium SCB49]